MRQGDTSAARNPHSRRSFAAGWPIPRHAIMRPRERTVIAGPAATSRSAYPGGTWASAEACAGCNSICAKCSGLKASTVIGFHLGEDCRDSHRQGLILSDLDPSFGLVVAGKV